MQWLQLQYDWEINLPLENKDTNDIKKWSPKFLFLSLSLLFTNLRWVLTNLMSEQTKRGGYFVSDTALNQ